MKKVVLFGAGKYYQKYKHFIEDEIVAICDNAKEKKGKRIDGHLVISPDEIMHYNPDEIIILSIYINEIREQLCKLGIDSSTIKAFYDIKYKKEIKEKIYNNPSLERLKETKKSVLVISHDLSINGAQIALLEAENQLRILGYDVTVASPDDGDIKDVALSNCNQVIVDEKLRFSKLSEIEWASTYSLVFLNTVQLFYLLRDLRPTQKVLWWLHEPECFYTSVDSRCLDELSYSQIHVYGVSDVACKAFQKICDKTTCSLLQLGKMDCPRTKEMKKSGQLECVLIGTISKLKGHDIVTRVVKRLYNEGYSNFSVDFIGDDSTTMASEIKTYVEKYDLPIKFLGKLSNEETLQIIESKNLLICASEVESFSLAVLEGMIKVVACLVSSAAGVSRYITEFKDGLVFSASQEDDLYCKLCWCMDNIDNLYDIGVQGRKIYEKYFSYGEFRNRLKKELYEIKEN